MVDSLIGLYRPTGVPPRSDNFLVWFGKAWTDGDSTVSLAYQAGLEYRRQWFTRRPVSDDATNNQPHQIDRPPRRTVNPYGEQYH